MNPILAETFKQVILANLHEKGFEVRSKDGTAIACLKLIGADDLNDDHLVQRVTDWRKRHKHCFLTEFEPTRARTKAWMQASIVNEPARALFMILSPAGILLGHIGAIYRETYLEYDYYILGVKPNVRNFALNVASQFLLWLLDLTQLQLACGKVRSDNHHGLDFHRRTGFSVYQKTPLVRVESKHGEVRFEEQSSSAESDYYLVEIRATAAELRGAALRRLESDA